MNSETKSILKNYVVMGILFVGVVFSIMVSLEVRHQMQRLKADRQTDQLQSPN